ncbi:MAG TPA: hypothetical protein VIY28_13115 [Pseudonocardiaceae bacterium]
MRDIRALPKAHLHLHLTGSMRPATLHEFADDPLLLGTRLAGQYQILRDVLGFGDDQLAVLARHSITASAAPPALTRRPEA